MGLPALKPPHSTLEPPVTDLDLHQLHACAETTQLSYKSSKLSAQS
jgi:hypothetical protein